MASRLGCVRRKDEMPPIETIARPVRNRISVKVPKEYSSYSFQVLLVPLAPGKAKWRHVGKVNGLSFKISDEDLFSDDASDWEACADGVPVA